MHHLRFYLISTKMWNHLPLDILTYILSFLSADSLARARAVSKHWHTCAGARLPSSLRQPPCFAAFPTRNNLHVSLMSCYVHNPSGGYWYGLPLDFLPAPTRPIATVDGLVICRSSGSMDLRLALFNPFTRQYRQLPLPNISRSNPAVGVVTLGPGPKAAHFQVYVAGGMSTMPRGSASTYEPTLEMYDSESDMWQVVGPMPAEFAVRLTVWTPNVGVYINGLLYWVTSAPAYSIMGLEIGSNRRVEFSPPMADRLEFATLVEGANGQLTLVGGGTCNDGACVWELGEGENWNLVAKVPSELGKKFLGRKESWNGTKCVGVDGVIWLYKELRSGMVVWRENVMKGKWEWVWVDGCKSTKGREVPNLPIRGLLIYPSLVCQCLYE